jgi:hypothetical protein
VKAESRIQESEARRKENQKQRQPYPFWLLDSDSWILLFTCHMRLFCGTKAARLLNSLAPVPVLTAREIYVSRAHTLLLNAPRAR